MVIWKITKVNFIAVHNTLLITKPFLGLGFPLTRRESICDILLRPIIEFMSAAKNSLLAPKHLVATTVNGRPQLTISHKQEL